MKKLLVVLLILTFMLGSISIFQSKQVFSHTESKIYHCAAWPWHDDFPGASNPSHPNSSRSSNAENPGEMRNVQKNPTATRTDSRELRRKSVDRSHLLHILCALWEVIFPESF
jgi:hypothetical protein